MLSKYSLDSIRYVWSISIGNETKNKAFAGVGNPKKSEELVLSRLNFANLNAAPIGRIKAINARGAIEKTIVSEKKLNTV